MRDSQQGRVYAAEYRLRGLYDTAEQIGSPVVELDGIRLTLPPEARFASVESVQAYCDRVCALIGTRPVVVRARKGDAKAHYERWASTIAVPDTLGSWAMREIVVLHELAHHISPGGHGPEFVAAMTDLLGQVMGVEVALAYRILCAHAGAKERQAV